MSAFGGKADMTFCESPLSRSLLGLKRASLIAAHMSGSDPKRTSATSIMSGDKAASANAGPAHPGFGYYGMVAFQPQRGGKLCKRPDFMKPFQISQVKNGAIGRPDRIWHWN